MVIVDVAKGSGLVLTNHHVVAAPTPEQRLKHRITEPFTGKATITFPSGQAVEGNVVGVDQAGGDLGAIAIPADASTPVIPLAATSPPVGSQICQVGYGGDRMQQRTGLLPGYRQNPWQMVLPFQVIPGDSGSGVFVLPQKELVGVVWGFIESGGHNESQAVTLANAGRFVLACRPLLPWRRKIDEQIGQAPRPPATPPAMPPASPPVAQLPTPPAASGPGPADGADKIKRELDALRATMEAELDAFRAAVEGRSADATKGAGELKLLQQIVGDLKTGHRDLAGEVAKLKASVTNNQGDVVSILNALKSRLDEARAAADVGTAKAGEVAGKLGPLATRIAAIETEVASHGPILGKLISQAAAPAIAGEAVSPILLATGPAGLGVAGLGLLVTLILARKRNAVTLQLPSLAPASVDAAAAARATPPAAIPAAPPATHEIKFVPVEKASAELAATLKAMEVAGRDYPGMMNVINTIQGLKKQLMATPTP